MSRIRTIKPEFWTDEKIVQLPYPARLLFIGMWNFADDEGLLRNEPDRIRMQVLPSDEIDVERMIDLLCVVGLIEVLETRDGDEIIAIRNFKRHQKVSHAAPTRFAVSSAKKKAILNQDRIRLAQKYHCDAGGEADANCYFCGAAGRIYWHCLNNGKPSAWVTFGGLEIDHFIAEAEGGSGGHDNLVLSCRLCNRGRRNADPFEYIQKPIPRSQWGQRQLASGNFPEDSRGLRPELKGIDLPSQEEGLVGTDTGDAVSRPKLVALNGGRA